MPTVQRSELGPGVALLTMDRPDRLNALNRELVEDLHMALDDVAADHGARRRADRRRAAASAPASTSRSRWSATACRPAWTTRSGSPGSCSSSTRSPSRSSPRSTAPAAGGGLALALASDVRLAAPEARFNVAFVKIGVSGADMGSSYFLPRIVGSGHASELMLTGRLVDAEEAARIGLANRVVPADQLLDAARDLAAEIVANAPFGVRMTKEVLRHSVDAQSAAAAIAMENRTQILAVQTGQIVEAMTAFAEKRPPNWD